MLHNIPEDQRSYLHHGRSLQSCKQKIIIVQQKQRGKVKWVRSFTWCLQ